jgi:CxxC motif-containing protein (DUF1111 family)
MNIRVTNKRLRIGVSMFAMSFSILGAQYVGAQTQTWQYTPPSTPNQSAGSANPSAPGGSIKAHDPGLREVTMKEPQPLPGLEEKELQVWASSKVKFEKTDTVSGDGLGPTFNLDNCQSCHAFPQTGGSSPQANPQHIYWEKNVEDKAKYPLPSFITADGPTREVRFKKSNGDIDGGVHDLFTIKSLDAKSLERAPDCKEEKSSLPKFDEEWKSGNAIFRIPTPTFGLGLIEQIRDVDIVENLNSKEKVAYRSQFDVKGNVNIVNSGNAVTGHVNTNGNDGTVARFGWKAQNKSLLIFSGEAYNVEMGISNELFPTERDETPACQPRRPSPDEKDTFLRGVPNDATNADTADLPYGVLSDIEKFAIFMRFLAPPAPSHEQPGGAASIKAGSQIFLDVGCAACHTPMLKTNPMSRVAALRDKEVFLYSDLAVHNMGKGLEDGIQQGSAKEREFRTAPLWGLGQRIWFLHDGRTRDMIQAIKEHSSEESEANKVVRNYEALSEKQKQDLLNFLRSL